MIADDVQLGEGVVIPHPNLVNLYGCVVGNGSKIGTFVEIQKGVSIGANCKISSHSFVCEGVTVEDGVFIGHGVMFINDRHPSAVTEDGELQTEQDWSVIETKIRSRASLGTGSTIMGGVTIGKSAMIGAGAVVTRDVPDYAIAVGVPARIVGDIRDKLRHGGSR